MTTTEVLKYIPAIIGLAVMVALMVFEFMRLLAEIRIARTKIKEGVQKLVEALKGER